MERITHAIAEGIAAGELGEDTQGMPASWVMITTHIDSKGKGRISSHSNEGALLHETIGLLDVGQTIYQGGVHDWLVEADDSG